MPWAGLRVLAFAGIGRPEKFFATLRGIGADLAETRAFPDHHAYRPHDLAALAGTTPDAVLLAQKLADLKRSGATALAIEASSIGLVQERTADLKLTNQRLIDDPSLERRQISVTASCVRPRNALTRPDGCVSAIVHADACSTLKWLGSMRP